jgi:hypothetical protein
VTEQREESSRGSSLTRSVQALTRMVSRPGKWLWKGFITGTPRSHFLAQTRQRSAEWHYARELRASLSEIDLDRPRPGLSVAFSHIPKCGGTSIHRWLGAELGLVKINSHTLMRAYLTRTTSSPVVSFGHMSVDSCIEEGVVTKEHLEAAHSFSLVRNPYTRVLSLFSHFRHYRHLPDLWSLDDFLIHLARSTPRIGFFNVARLSQAAPQVSWLRQARWSGPTTVLRVENAESINAFFAEMGVTSTYPSTRKSDSERYRGQWSERTSQLVLDVYGEDFETLSYSPSTLPFG